MFVSVSIVFLLLWTGNFGEFCNKIQNKIWIAAFHSRTSKKIGEECNAS